MGTSPKYDIDDFDKATKYNIDLFQGEGEEKKVNVGKSGGDVEMKEEKKSSKKSKGPKKDKKDDGSDGEGDSGSSSSDSNSSSSESQKGDEAAAQIEVPASVIQRFFGKKESLSNYLAGINQETTFAMLEDLCATYKYEEANREELTEFCYILFESLKASLVCQDMIKCKPQLIN